MTSVGASHPAIDLARAACALDPPSQALRALELSWDAGASADQTAALAASFGRADLLAQSLAHGADPNGCSPVFHDRSAALWPSEAYPRLSLLARSLLAGSAPCCSALCEAGAHLLVDASFLDLCGRLPHDGVARWPLISASLSATVPNHEGAQRVAQAVIAAVARTFDPDTENMADGVAAALAVLERLCELGARLDTGTPSLAQNLFELACNGISRAHGADGPQKAMELLCSLCERHDPAAGSQRVAACLRALCKTPGGASSSLPEPAGALALRLSLSRSARQCSNNDPAALAVLCVANEGLSANELYSSQAVSLPLLMTTSSVRAGRKSLAWLVDESASWAPPSPEALQACSRAMLDALCASARLFGQQPQDRSNAPASWLNWAGADFAEPKPAHLGAGLPLMAAQLAAQSHGALALLFKRALPAAAALAEPNMTLDELAASREAADVSISTPAAISVPSLLRL